MNLLLGWLLGSSGLLNLLDLLGASGLGSACWQWLRSFHWLAEECSVLGGSLLHLLKHGLDHAVLRALDEAELETFEVGQVGTLKKVFENCQQKSMNISVGATYLSLGASTLSPESGSPLFLQVEFLEGLLDDASWSGEGELDDELGQMQVADWVLLSWDAGQRSIDEHLKRGKTKLASDAQLQASR